MPVVLIDTSLPYDPKRHVVLHQIPPGTQCKQSSRRLLIKIDQRDRLLACLRFGVTLGKLLLSQPT